MLTLKTFTNLTFLLLIMTLISCSGQRPTNIGITENRLAACPDSPNCVSSDADDDAHKTLPLQLNASSTDAWQMTKRLVSELPRTKIITETSDYLHAECSSAVLGFVDDLELHHRPTEGIIAIRSASRLGHSDFGVNRKRIETLRVLLVKQGLTN